MYPQCLSDCTAHRDSNANGQLYGRPECQRLEHCSWYSWRGWRDEVLRGYARKTGMRMKVHLPQIPLNRSLSNGAQLHSHGVLRHALSTPHSAHTKMTNVLKRCRRVENNSHSPLPTKSNRPTPSLTGSLRRDKKNKYRVRCRAQTITSAARSERMRRESVLSERVP